MRDYPYWYDDVDDDRPSRAELENDARIDAEWIADQESFDAHYGPEFEDSNITP